MPCKRLEFYILFFVINNIDFILINIRSVKYELIKIILRLWNSFKLLAINVILNFEKQIHFYPLQTSHLEIKHLQSECTYNVNVRNIFNEISSKDENGVSIEFFTTGCLGESEEDKDNNFSHGRTTQCKTNNKLSKRKRHYATYFWLINLDYVVKYMIAILHVQMYEWKVSFNT